MTNTTNLNIEINRELKTEADEITTAELIRRINNIKNGKGVFLTDEEFEKQSE